MYRLYLSIPCGSWSEIQLHDYRLAWQKCIISNVTDCHMTSDFTICTPQKELNSQPQSKGKQILHSNQNSVVYIKNICRILRIHPCSQSISKAKNPYDNALIKRYFNILKNECTNLREFKTEESLYQTVEEFAHVNYNHICPTANA